MKSALRIWKFFKNHYGKLFFFLFPVFWFSTTAIVLFAVSLYLFYQKPDSVKNGLLAKINPLAYSLFFSNPPVLGSSTQDLRGKDGRGLILEQYLSSQKAPLAPHGQYMVEIADQYGFDWTLLPAIAMQESSGGKVTPDDSYNAWGWAVYGSTAKKFTSWEDAIERVARGLKTDYLDQGLVTPEQIMQRYCPRSIAKGGSWAKGVEYFMGLFNGEF